jgi:hypothetical protein
MIDQKAIERIREIICSYVYSDLNNLLEASALVYDRALSMAVLVDYVPEDYSTRDNNGTCLKLTKLALDEIRKEFEGKLEVRAVTGHAPTLFTPKNQGLHNYLIISSGKDAFVVDPSLKYIAPLEGSGYTPIEDLTDFSLLYQSNLMLGPDDAVPLLINSDGGLVRLGFEISRDLFKLIIFTTEKDGKDYLNYSCGKTILSGKFIPDKIGPQHALEEKLTELVKNSTII